MRSLILSQCKDVDDLGKLSLNCITATSVLILEDVPCGRSRCAWSLMHRLQSYSWLVPGHYSNGHNLTTYGTIFREAGARAYAKERFLECRGWLGSWRTLESGSIAEVWGSEAEPLRLLGLREILPPTPKLKGFCLSYIRWSGKMYVVFCILQCAVFHGRFMEKRYDTRKRVIYQSYIRAEPLTICIHNAVQVHVPRPLSSEYDTIRKTSLTWTQKLSDQLSPAHEARKNMKKKQLRSCASPW